jgi:hypothetical protein
MRGDDGVSRESIIMIRDRSTDVHVPYSVLYYPSLVTYQVPCSSLLAFLTAAIDPGARGNDWTALGRQSLYPLPDRV